MGTVQLSLTDDGKSDPLFSDLPEMFSVQTSHGDVVTELPPGALPLARNDHSGHQSFRLGDAIWGTQFHPEFTPTIVSNLIYALVDRLPPESFPRWNACVDPLRGWLLSSVREAPEAQRCLENFLRIVEERSRT